MQPDGLGDHLIANNQREVGQFSAEILDMGAAHSRRPPQLLKRRQRNIRVFSENGELGVPGPILRTYLVETGLDGGPHGFVRPAAFLTSSACGPSVSSRSRTRCAATAGGAPRSTARRVAPFARDSSMGQRPTRPSRSPARSCGSSSTPRDNSSRAWSAVIPSTFSTIASGGSNLRFRVVTSLVQAAPAVRKGSSWSAIHTSSRTTNVGSRSSISCARWNPACSGSDNPGRLPDIRSHRSSIFTANSGPRAVSPVVIQRSPPGYRLLTSWRRQASTASTVFPKPPARAGLLSCRCPCHLRRLGRRATGPSVRAGQPCKGCGAAASTAWPTSHRKRPKAHLPGRPASVLAEREPHGSHRHVYQAVRLFHHHRGRGRKLVPPETAVEPGAAGPAE